MTDRLVTSKALLFRPGPDGSFVAWTSLSRPIFEVDDLTLSVIREFGVPATRAQAFSRLGAGFGQSRAEFDELSGRLLKLGALINADKESEEHAATLGFASLVQHHVMLRDTVRVLAYRGAIAAACKDKTVAEIGCGTGILSVFAAQAGAKRVYSIEETEIGSLARKIFRENGLEKTIHLIRGNSCDVDVPEQVDVLIHELLGMDPFSENLIPVIEDAKKRFLKKGGKLIPDRIEVFCVGCEAEFTPSLATRVLLEAREFDAQFGLKLGPFQAALKKSAERDEFNDFFPSQSADLRGATYRGTILTEETLLGSVDLNDGPKPSWKESPGAKLIARESGKIGSVVVFFRARLDERTWISNSPFTARTNWGWWTQELTQPVDVKAKQRLGLRARLENESGRQRLRVEIRPKV